MLIRTLWNFIVAYVLKRDKSTHDWLLLFIKSVELSIFVPWINKLYLYNCQANLAVEPPLYGRDQPTWKVVNNAICFPVVQINNFSLSSYYVWVGRLQALMAIWAVMVQRWQPSQTHIICVLMVISAVMVHRREPSQTHHFFYLNGHLSSHGT